MTATHIEVSPLRAFLKERVLDDTDAATEELLQGNTRLGQRRLREAQAKYDLMALHVPASARTTEECRATQCCEEGCEITYCEGCGALVDEDDCPEMKILASIYRDHWDWLPEWEWPILSEGLTLRA